MSEKDRLPEGVTSEQVKQWTRKHKAVYPIRIDTGHGVVVGLFRKPTLSDMSAAASVGTGNPMAAGELLYNSCKLAVDPELETDDEAKVAAINGVSRLFRILEAEVGEPLSAGE